MDTVKNAGSGQIPSLNLPCLATIPRTFTDFSLSVKIFVPVVLKNYISLYKSR